MGKNLDKMKQAVDASRKTNGEPPRPKTTPLLPSPKKKVRLTPAERSEVGAKYAAERETVPAPGPEKPSEATEAVTKVVLTATIEHFKDDDWNNLSLSRAIAVALVRRFPGLTNKPKSKHRRCCGTLAGSAPHEPTCSEHPDSLAAKRAEKAGGP